VRQIVYEGGGHAFHWEDPERVAAALVRFGPLSLGGEE
jgi:pimeloyl-ACP methyl ester carboxylesterase